MFCPSCGTKVQREGQRFCTSCGVALVDTAVHEATEAVAELSVRRGTLSGPLRLSAPVSFGTLHLSPILARFATAHPGLTLRIDHLDDQDSWLFGAVDGQSQARRSLTIAPTFTLDEGLGALLELRVDQSDREAFLDSDGLPTDSAVTFAVEMTGSF